MKEPIDNNIPENSSIFKKLVRVICFFIIFMILDIIIGIISYPSIAESGNSHPVFLSLFWFPFYLLCASIPINIIIIMLISLFEDPIKPLDFNERISPNDVADKPTLNGLRATII